MRKSSNKKERRLASMQASMALALADRLLQEPFSLKKYDKVRRLSFWEAPPPTLKQIKEHMDYLERDEFADVYRSALSGHPVAQEVLQQILNDPVLAEEFVLDQLERLEQAGARQNDIAYIMGVHVSTIYYWRKMIAKRRQQQFDRLPASRVRHFAGEVLRFYEKIEQLGFQMIFDEAASAHREYQGIRIAMRAKDKTVRYQTLLGYYDDKSKLLLNHA